MGGTVRFVALDKKHDRDLGYPVTPDDVAPDLLGKPVWGVWEQVEDDSEDGYHNVPVSGGLTAAEAEDEA